MQELTAEVVFKLAIKIFIALCAVSVLLLAIWMFFGDYLKRKFKQLSERGQESSKQTALRHDSAAGSSSQGLTGAEHIVLIGAAGGSDFTSPAEMGTGYGSSDSIGAGGDNSGESGGSDSGGYESGGDYGGGGSGGGWS